jgi:flagellar basal-body rod protein FlgB
MAINDLPVLSALRTKMQWHQERQRVLAENVSNSDTPNFKPRDLVEPKFDNNGANARRRVRFAMMRTSASHMRRAGGDSFRRRQDRIDRPAGNASISKTRC